MTRIKIPLVRNLPTSGKIVYPDDKRFFSNSAIAGDGDMIVDYSGTNPALLALETTEVGEGKYAIYSQTSFYAALGQKVIEEILKDKRKAQGEKLELLLELPRLNGSINFNDTENRALLASARATLTSLSAEREQQILSGA